MTIEEAQAFIPREFTIACNKIITKVVDEGEDFGSFDSLRNIINISLGVRDASGNLVTFTKEQVLNTYYHEVFHCFNYFFNTEMDEALAQTFANFTCEYITSKIY